MTVVIFDVDLAFDKAPVFFLNRRERLADRAQHDFGFGDIRIGTDFDIEFEFNQIVLNGSLHFVLPIETLKRDFRGL